MSTFTDKIEKESSYTVALAVESFLGKNCLSPEDIQITVLNKKEKVIIRIFNKDWNIESNRKAEKTIYHGWRFDVFTWTCQTRSSGILEYDDVLTDEYRFKCE